VHLATTTAAVHRLDASGLAELLTRLDLTSGTEVVTRIGPARAADAVARAHPTVGRRIMLALEQSDAARVLDELPARIDEQYRDVVGSWSPLARRRFRRLRGWRRYAPPTTDAARSVSRPGHDGLEDDRGLDR
jgi:hypothetical protein